MYGYINMYCVAVYTPWLNASHYNQHLENKWVAENEGNSINTYSHCYLSTWAGQPTQISELWSYLWRFGTLSISGIFYVRYVQKVRILQTRR